VHCHADLYLFTAWAQIFRNPSFTSKNWRQEKQN